MATVIYPLCNTVNYDTTALLDATGEVLNGHSWTTASYMTDIPEAPKYLVNQAMYTKPVYWVPGRIKSSYNADLGVVGGSLTTDGAAIVGDRIVGYSGKVVVVDKPNNILADLLMYSYYAMGKGDHQLANSTVKALHMFLSTTYENTPPSLIPKPLDGVKPYVL